MIASKIVQSIALARSGVYFLESIPFILVNRYFAHSDLPPPTPAQLRGVWDEMVKLQEQEARNVVNRLYPVKALDLENPLRHTLSYAEVLLDGLGVAWRMRRNVTKAFNKKTRNLKKDLPEYYTRNFHFQTDGYLSEASAKRYDHQVEILFNGAAGAMRRMILPPLKQHSSRHGHWLEIGCGTGSATRAVLETFPQAKVTALDLSAPYLKVAQENLRPYNNVDFVQGQATQLDFKDNTFDVVYSVYLFHELPSEEREKVMQEAYRVLKPGGLLVVADSLQMHDNPNLDWALERFPMVYHEPFYKDYSGKSLEKLVQQTTRQTTHSTHRLFTKVVWTQKPEGGEHE